MYKEYELLGAYVTFITLGVILIIGIVCLIKRNWWMGVAGVAIGSGSFFLIPFATVLTEPLFGPENIAWNFVFWFFCYAGAILWIEQRLSRWKPDQMFQT